MLAFSLSTLVYLFCFSLAACSLYIAARSLSRVQEIEADLSVISGKIRDLDRRVVDLAWRGRDCPNLGQDPKI